MDRENLITDFVPLCVRVTHTDTQTHGHTETHTDTQTHTHLSSEGPKIIHRKSGLTITVHPHLV